MWRSWRTARSSPIFPSSSRAHWVEDLSGTTDSLGTGGTLHRSRAAMRHACPSVVSFNVDGTLVDLQRVLDCALTCISHELERLLGRTFPALELQALRNTVAAEPAFAEARLEVIRRESFRRAVVLLGGDASQHLDELCDLFFERRHSLHLIYPDVEPALQRLHGYGLRIIVASNGNSNLSRTPMGAFLEAAFYADDIGYKKA